MSAKISRKQQEILDYLKKEILTKGYPPTVREICEKVNLKSTSSVHAHLQELEKSGALRRDATKPRALELCDFPKGRTVPLLGKVTAGQPILAQQNIEDELVLPSGLVADEDTFALRVEGESMIEAGILSGDIVIVRRQQAAENGEIVVAMTDEDEATLKRIYYEEDRVRLQPENPTMAPIYVESATVLGKLVALIRQF